MSLRQYQCGFKHGRQGKRPMKHRKREYESWRHTQAYQLGFSKGTKQRTEAKDFVCSILKRLDNKAPWRIAAAYLPLHNKATFQEAVDQGWLTMDWLATVRITEKGLKECHEEV